MHILDIIVFTVFALIVLLVFVGLSKKTSYFAPDFQACPIMNKPETFLFDLLIKETPSHWHVMTQVSYGAFLRNKSRNKYMSINSKRADFIILYPSLDVAAVIEYQGKGHFGYTDQDQQRAERSDQIKREACLEANISLIEVPARINPQDIHEEINAIVKPNPQPDADSEE